METEPVAEPAAAPTVGEPPVTEPTIEPVAMETEEPAEPVVEPVAEPPAEPETLRSLLEAARLGDKIGAFEDDEIDLDAILEAHRAGDLMDLLREVGLKAGERLRVERALSADPPAPVAAPAEAATEPVPEPVMEPAAEPAAAAEPMPPLPEPVAEPAAAEAPQLVAGFSSPSRWAADGQNDVETITWAPPTPCNTPSSDAALEAPAEADASEEDEADEDAESRLGFYEGSLVRKQRRFAAPRSSRARRRRRGAPGRPRSPPRTMTRTRTRRRRRRRRRASSSATSRRWRARAAAAARGGGGRSRRRRRGPRGPRRRIGRVAAPAPAEEAPRREALTVTRPAAPPQGEDPAPAAAPDDAAAAGRRPEGRASPPRKKRRGAPNGAAAGRGGAERGPPLPAARAPRALGRARRARKRRPDAAGAFPGAARARRRAPPVRVPPLVAQRRPHQREGVRFLYDCVAGLREYHPGFRGYGAVLADDMGLGKTLQTVALVYALLRHGAVPPATEPFRRVVVACPCSLVANWKAEFDKWINGRAATLRERVTVKAVDADPSKAIAAFGAGSRPFQVLVISYESLAAHASGLGPAACDLLVCDEAQRLKGRKTKTARALGALRTKRRVLLTGTPLQNDLEEFYALAGFANPGVLGPPEAFRRGFARPIAAGLARGADPDEVALRERKQAVLAEVATRFLLRRENRLNAAHLPRKLVQVVVCRATAAQRAAYGAVLADKATRRTCSRRSASCRTSATTPARARVVFVSHFFTRPWPRPATRSSERQSASARLAARRPMIASPSSSAWRRRRRSQTSRWRGCASLALVPAGRPHAVQGAPEARTKTKRRRPRDRVGSMA